MRRGISFVEFLVLLVIGTMFGAMIFLSSRPTPPAVKQAQAVARLQGTLPGAAVNVRDLGNNWREFELTTGDGKKRRFLYRDTSHTAHISNFTHSELLVELQ